MGTICLGDDGNKVNVGTVEADGTIRVGGAKIGHIDDRGAVFAGDSSFSGQQVGRVDSSGNV